MEKKTIGNIKCKAVVTEERFCLSECQLQDLYFYHECLYAIC